MRTNQSVRNCLKFLRQEPDPRFPVGKRFGELTVLGEARICTERGVVIMVSCDCGKAKFMRKKSLLDGFRTCGNHLLPPTKIRARGRLRAAITLGRIVKPSTCANCGRELEKEKIHGHHHNGYDNALDVVWWCARCHIQHHRKLFTLRGEAHPKAKLTEVSVLNIRQELALGTPRKILAARHHVTVPAICAIAVRRSWKHLI